MFVKRGGEVRIQELPRRRMMYAMEKKRRGTGVCAPRQFRKN